MNILATQYTLQRKSFEIYISGCKGNPHCEGCHNQLSWNFEQGNKYDKDYFESIKDKVKTFNNMISNVEIFGGEPLDQNYLELEQFLINIKTLNKTIWLFTRYDLKDVPSFVKNICDYIKCGRYIKELSCTDNIMYGIKLATSNQKIYKKGLNY